MRSQLCKSEFRSSLGRLRMPKVFRVSCQTRDPQICQSRMNTSVVLSKCNPNSSCFVGSAQADRETWAPGVFQIFLPFVVARRVPVQTRRSIVLSESRRMITGAIYVILIAEL